MTSETTVRGLGDRRAMDAGPTCPWVRQADAEDGRKKGSRAITMTVEIPALCDWCNDTGAVVGDGPEGLEDCPRCRPL